MSNPKIGAWWLCVTETWSLRLSFPLKSGQKRKKYRDLALLEQAPKIYSSYVYSFDRFVSMLYDENYFDKMVPRENEYRKKKP